MINVIECRKICVACNQEFPETKEHFYQNGVYFLSRCKACHKKRCVERFKERRNGDPPKRRNRRSNRPNTLVDWTVWAWNQIKELPQAQADSKLREILEIAGIQGTREGDWIRWV